MRKRLEHKIINGTEFKFCTKCDSWKPIGEFHNSARHWDELYPRCKICTAIHRKQYYEVHGESERSIHKAYCRKNRDKLKIDRRKYFIANQKREQAKARAYYHRNRKKCLADNREYYRKHHGVRCRYAKHLRNEHAKYDKFIDRIRFAEKVRRDPQNHDLLQVACAYCGMLFNPKDKEVSNRIQALFGNTTGERRLYCSGDCKKVCPTYRQQKYPKGFKIGTSREVQPELRQLVFSRDSYECQKCGAKEYLHCHHILSVKQEPLESADIDVCITLCKNCHKETHKQDGCRYSDLKCA